MKKNLQYRKAFTLIELLFTIIVATLVIGGVFMSLINTLVLNEYNQGFSIAMNIARSQMEQTLANRRNFASITTSPTNPGSDLFTPGSSTVGWRLSQANNGIDGLLGMEVTDAISGGAVSQGTELAHIKIVVCWRGRAGRIIGGCRNNSGTLYWNTFSSPCVLETEINRYKN